MKLTKVIIMEFIQQKITKMKIKPLILIIKKVKPNKNMML